MTSEEESQRRNCKDYRLDEIWSHEYQRVQCIEWITNNKYKNVCLQFPDSLLVHSETICTDIKDSLPTIDGNAVEVFIMADTTYGDCCVDEITASHVGADSIVHFGNACLSETISLPVFYCYPRLSISRKRFQEQLTEVVTDTTDAEILIYLDIGYHHLLTEQYSPIMQSEIQDIDRSFIQDLVKMNTRQLYIIPCACNYYSTLELKLANKEKDNDNNDNEDEEEEEEEYILKCLPNPLPLTRTNDNDNDDDNDDHENISLKRICVFVGTIEDNRRFFNLTLTMKTSQDNWYIYDPVREEMLREPKSLTVFSRYIRKRSYYMEKCKDAQILGILVATVTMPGYLDIVKRLQSLAQGNGIRTRIIYVGRINPSKLANFMEIDCYILIGCPFNSIYESKDYFKPIVSVFEAEMALNPAWHLRYPDIYLSDFRELLPNGQHFNDYQEYFEKRKRRSTTANLDDNDNDDDGLRNISLVNGSIRTSSFQASTSTTSTTNPANELEQGSTTTTTTTIADQQQAIVMNLNKGLTLSDRSWRGLEQSLGLSEPSKLVKGLSGIPTHYDHENSSK